MKEESLKLIAKARRTLEAAKTLHRADLAEAACGRAYYAMFHAVRALLIHIDVSASKHGGVHSAFGEHFVKTGKVEADRHRWLIDAYDQRIAGDYGYEITLTSADAKTVIDRAELIIASATTLIEGRP